MTAVHLLQCVFDTRALLAFANAQGLLHREVDDGYIVHAAFAALFGDRAPAPFVLEDALEPRPHQSDAAPGQVVLAYSSVPLADLRSHASNVHQHLVRWDRSASKSMPAIASEREVGFVIRAMPTVRSRATRPDQLEGGRGHGREIDAFLAACFRDRDAVIDRATVYRDWIASKLSASRDGASSPATLTDFSLRRFERVRLLRKEKSANDRRKRHVVERPDAVIAGSLRVGDADAFRALLVRGIGRHRAFGFGMLLLRPVR